MMWWYGHGFSVWWMVAGMLSMLIFWGSIIALIVWVVLRLTRPRGSSHPTDPLSVLQDRYARGEISREQAQQMQQDLQG